MNRWLLVLAAALAWTGAVVLNARFGDELGAYVVLTWAMAVGVTGVAFGAWPAVLAGVLVGSLVAFGAPVDGSGPGDWRARVAEGALLLPLALVVVGGGAAAGRTLLRQLRHHRGVSDRAQYDGLTGALNRRAFEARLDEWIRHPRGGTPGFALLFVDLDRFKFVNDTFGHAVGDQMLVTVARELMASVRDGDLVARQGGDEFLVALAGVRDADVAAAVAEKLLGLFSGSFEVEGKAINVSASIGVALHPRDGATVHAMVQSADAAMYAVKTGGKNAFYFSSSDQRHRQARRLELERRLRTALREHEFEVVYQPQIELGTGKVCGFEALLRWRNPELGMVPPNEFIPIAEEAGMIVPMGHWLMREACRQAQVWAAYGPHVTMAINVSSLQFRQPDFVEQVGAAIRDAGVAPSRIELEVTESILIDQFELAVETLRRLDAMGVKAALDDFGTGYSSLAYLQKLPIRALKIDRSFVRELVLGPSGVVGDALPIVEAIAAMGLKLGKVVVAEGVETEAQARFLHRIGVAIVQGYHYAKPMAAERAEALLKQLTQLAGHRGTTGTMPDGIDPVAGVQEGFTHGTDPRASGVWPPPKVDPVPVKLPLPRPETEAVRTFGDYVLILDG